MSNASFSPNFQKLAKPSPFWILATLVSALVLPAPQAAANQKYAGYVLDANNGAVLYEDRANERRYPASLTKMMTLYLAFEGLDDGRFHKRSLIKISKNAAAEPPSKLGLRAGATITVDDAMHALVTKSANDVATALGEFLAGSETKFAAMATAKARYLGMHSTTFRNAHGLPDNRQVTTARDMALLGVALRRHFPHYYGIFQTKDYRIGALRLRSHNRLVGSYPGVDGIKTGYIRASGFNLVTSVEKDGRSVVAVVLGGRTAASRDAHMRALLDRYLLKGSQKGPKRAQVAAIGTRTGPMLPASGPLPLAQAVDSLLTGAVPRGTAGPSWAIQIAAVPDRDQALAILSATRSRFEGLLAQTTPLLNEVRTDDTQLFRVRFVGFPAVGDARSACRGIQASGGDCWVTTQ